MYVIYGHFIDNVCVYVGSNCRKGDENRPYDFINRTKFYKEITKNKKIEVRILKKFPDIIVNPNELNGFVQSEEMKMIKYYHDKGEAIASKQDYREKNNPMFGKKHTKESIRKNRESQIGEKHWFNKLTEEEKEKRKKEISIKYSGKNNPNFGNGDKIKGDKNPSKRPEVIKKIKDKISNRYNLYKEDILVKNFVGTEKLYEYCKQEYNLSSGTVKKLIRTRENFIPYYSKHEKAKNIKIIKESK